MSPFSPLKWNSFETLNILATINARANLILYLHYHLSLACGLAENFFWLLFADPICHTTMSHKALLIKLDKCLTRDGFKEGCLRLRREGCIWSAGAQLREGSWASRPLPFSAKEESTLFVVPSIFKNCVSLTCIRRVPKTFTAAEPPDFLYSCLCLDEKWK